MLHDFTYFRSFIPPNICNEIRGSFDSLAADNATTSNDSMNIDANYRQHKVVPVDGQEHITNLVMSSCINANTRNFAFNIYNHPSNISVHRYDAPKEQSEGDHYHWHSDLAADAYKPTDGSMNYSDRKLSFVAQLSDPDEYEGGDFEFHGFEPSEKTGDPGFLEMKDAFRQQGTVIVFPSFIMHRVKPITKGTRFSLVSWVEGPKFH